MSGWWRPLCRDTRFTPLFTRVSVLMQQIASSAHVSAFDSQAALFPLVIQNHFRSVSPPHSRPRRLDGTGAEEELSFLELPRVFASEAFNSEDCSSGEDTRGRRIAREWTLKKSSNVPGGEAAYHRIRGLARAVLWPFSQTWTLPITWLGTYDSKPDGIPVATQKKISLG